jgi:hypothetical protein
LRRIVRHALVAAALAPTAAPAQSPRVVRSQANAWLVGSADVWATPHWGLQSEVMYERSELGAAPQQIEVRAGLQRLLHSGARVAVGGTFVHNSPYGPFAARASSSEYRAWEQLTIDQRTGVVSLTHRYRFEQRWVERPLGATATGAPATDVAYGLRLRYQARATVPLTPTSRPHPLYAIASDEVFLSLGPHAPLNLLDQNRAYLGAGVRWSPRLRTELGYMDQVILRADGRQVENNNTLHVAFGLTRPAPVRR